MNGVKNETHVRIEQTARGIWYCSGLDVYAENHVDVGMETDLLMTVIEQVLDRHNKVASIETQHADLSTQKDEMKKALKVKQ